MSYHHPIFNKLSDKIISASKELFPEIALQKEDIYPLFVEAPDIQLGHFAFPCFTLSKKLKLAPPKIAKMLQEKITTDDTIFNVQNAGPYLNFFITSNSFFDLVISQIIDDKFFSLKLIEKSEKMMIEYSQPNTHKELHVGHMRNMCLGNALVRLHRYIGNEVITATYPGDVGTHVAKCLWYLKFHQKGELPTQNKGKWLGELYSKASNKLEDEKDGPNKEKNQQILTTILKDLEKGSGEYFDLWQTTRTWSIDLMKDVYSWANIEFDHWYFESQVDSESLEFAKKLFHEKKFIESDGAIGMDLSEDKLGFCMMIKSDGTGMYATKDISLAYKKFQDYNLDSNIYIVDKRQELHFKQVFKVLEKLGHPNAKNCHHLQYDFVELPSGAMASRKGNIIPITDLIEQMQAHIKDNYLHKFKDEWSAKEIENTAKILANGAIKYGMIRVDNNRKIVFEMSEWLKLDGETGPYLQYVCARINSLCEKQNFDLKKSVDFSLLIKKEETALMLKLSQFNVVSLASAKQNKTTHICSYLFDLGKLFNNFYAECSIAKAESETLKNSRLMLSYAVLQVMTKGLSLLGIEAPKRM